MPNVVVTKPNINTVKVDMGDFASATLTSPRYYNVLTLKRVIKCPLDNDIIVVTSDNGDLVGRFTHLVNHPDPQSPYLLPNTPYDGIYGYYPALTIDSVKGVAPTSADDLMEKIIDLLDTTTA